MKNLKVIAVLSLMLASAQSLAATSPKDMCAYKAVKAAIAEIHREYPGVGGTNKVSNVDEDEDIVSLNVDNEDINDMTLDIVVSIEHAENGVDCTVKGTPSIQVEDNS